MCSQRPSISPLVLRGPKYHRLAHTSLTLCHVQNSFRTHDLTISDTGKKTLYSALFKRLFRHFLNNLLYENLWVQKCEKMKMGINFLKKKNLFWFQQFHHGNKQGFWIFKELLTQTELYFYAHDSMFVFDSFSFWFYLFSCILEDSSFWLPLYGNMCCRLVAQPLCMTQVVMCGKLRIRVCKNDVLL